MPQHYTDPIDILRLLQTAYKLAKLKTENFNKI